MANFDDALDTQRKLESEDGCTSSTSRLGFDPMTIPPSLGNLAIQESPQSKISSLKIILEKDLVAADLKWSLFVAASHSYRHDSCLRPFPPMYIKNECKDIEALVRLVCQSYSISFLFIL